MSPAYQRGIFILLLILTAVLSWRIYTLTQVVEQGNGADARDVTPRGELRDDEKATIQLFREASPSVVYITTANVRRDRWTMRALEVPRGTGTGFVWDDAGHVVTNFHVVQGADSAQVMLWDHTVYNARLVGAAPDKDLAVLLIEAPRDQLRPIPLGESHDLAVGQSALAIGNPFGFDQTLTTGVISGLGREIESVTRRPITGAIQTDAAINPGNSGGPLLDTAGRLIGVNTAIYSPSGSYAGIGFAVPVDTVARIVPQLITHGRIVRPGLGVRIADDDVVRRLGTKGVLIMHVPAGSAAAKAGLRGTRQAQAGRIALGDLIVSVGVKTVRNSKDLFRALDGLAVGDPVVLTVRRDGSELSVKLPLSALE